MAQEYGSLTVAVLRAILKERGIASTGLTRKAQIIEKLEEDDARKTSGGPEETQHESPATLQADQPVSEASSMTMPTEESQEKTEATQDVEQGTESQRPPVAESQPLLGSSATTHSPEEQVLESQPWQEPEKAPENSLSQTPVPSRESEVMPPPQESNMSEAVRSEDMNSTKQTARREDTATSQISTAPTLSRLNSQELLEIENRKRKRSATPPVDEKDIDRKRARQSKEIGGEVHLREDAASTQEHMAKADVTMSGTAQQAAAEYKEESDAPMEESEGDESEEHSKEPTGEESVPEPSMTSRIEAVEKVVEPTEGKDTSEARTESSHSHVDIKPNDADQEENPVKRPLNTKAERKDALFKPLFTPTTESQYSSHTGDDNKLRTVAPALHPETSAVYIRNFSRPLNLPALRTHLITIATLPNHSPDPLVLKKFWMDSIRTHLFAVFDSALSASRVREAMHGVVWPPEGQRHTLWADFVPQGKVIDWIDEEEDAAMRGRSGSMTRFEVVYEPTANGEMEAVFQEVGGTSKRKPDLSHRAPSIPQTTQSKGSNHQDYGDREPPRGHRSLADDYIHPSRRETVPQARQTTPSGNERNIHPSRRGLVDNNDSHIHPSRRGLIPSGPPAPSNAMPVPRPSSGPSIRKESNELAAPFRALDDLFESTKTKPKLYFEPVAKEVADRRLNELHHELPRLEDEGMDVHPSEALQRKFTFDKEDRLISAGTVFARDGVRGGPSKRGGFSGRRGGFDRRGT
jgi:hypothetical protein